MSEAGPKSLWTTLKSSWVIYLVAMIVAACTFLVNKLSYSWRPLATLCDVEVSVDEGLAVLLVPITPIAAKETPVSTFVVYERGPNVWTAGVAGRVPIRTWMATFSGPHRAMLASFGYWLGDWQSKPRPGPFIEMFVPLWFLGVATFGAFLAVHFRLVKFGLRALFVFITLSAVLLFFLGLRSAPLA